MVAQKIIIPILAVISLVIATKSYEIRRQTAEDHCSPIEIDDQNWTILLKDEWILIICAMDRPDCKKLELNSHKLAAASVYSSLKVGLIIVDLSKAAFLLRRFWAFHLPVVYHVNYGEFRIINPELDVESLCQLVEDREWLLIDPMPNWKHPTSFWTCLSVFGYKTGIDLWQSEIVSSYKAATWVIGFIFTGFVSMFILMMHVIWHSTSFF